MNTSQTDSSKTIEQIKHFIPHTSANPSIHTCFPFTEPAYICAFKNTNLCIHLHTFQNQPHIPYALFLQKTHIYTRFYFDEHAYRSSDILGQCSSSDQINSSQLILYFSKDSPDHRSKHSINRSRQYIDISDLEIPLHHFLHRCRSINILLPFSFRYTSE